MKRSVAFGVGIVLVSCCYASQAYAAPYSNWDSTMALAYRTMIEDHIQTLRDLSKAVKADGHPELACPSELISYNKSVYNMIGSWLQDDAHGDMTEGQKMVYHDMVQSLDDANERYIDSVRQHIAGSTSYVAPGASHSSYPVQSSAERLPRPLRASQTPYAARVLHIHMHL